MYSRLFVWSDCESLTRFSLRRERQDTDGQMKELQDQLEAEQYFSVSLLYDYRCGCKFECYFVLLLNISLSLFLKV